MVASGSFVPVLPIVVGVPFIVIVLGAVSDDKNVGEGRKGASEAGDATPIRSKGGSEGDQVDFWSIRDGNLEWSLQPAAISVRRGHCRKFGTGSEQCKEGRREESQLIRRDDKAEKVPFCLSPPSSTPPLSWSESYSERRRPSFVDKGLL